MRFLIGLSFLVVMSLSAHAQDAAVCDRIAAASESGSIQKLADAEIDSSLCETSKLVLAATTGANKALQDRCTPAMSAIMRELMRRNRDAQEARAACRKRP